MKYLRGEYQPIEKDEYVCRAVYVLTHISPSTVVHRLTGDCPKELLVAPMWNTEKNDVLKRINEKMQSEGSYQGKFYKNSL